MKKTLFSVLVLITTTVLGSTAMAAVPVGLDPSIARITFEGDGYLLVSDFSYERVLTLAPDTLEVINEMQINGKPLGIAWADGLLYLGNSTTGQVEVYDATGQLQLVLGDGFYPVAMPQDIAIGDGYVYVVDGAEKVVKIFSSNGSFVGTIPENGYDPDILANPTAIAVDDVNRQIYVSDYGDLGNTARPIDPRVQVFSSDGGLAYTINSGRIDKYLFTMPQGLATSVQGDLFMIDSLSGSIHVFDTARGRPLYVIDIAGNNNNGSSMKMPVDLVVDSTTNEVFVTDNLLSTVLVFSE